MNLISIQFTFVLVLVVYSWAVSGTACTSIASTNPTTPLLGLNPIDFTILDSQYEDLVIHGNTVDQKCDDASILAPGGSTFTVSSEQLLVQMRASSKLYLCSTQGIQLCSFDRYIPVVNTRNGGRKFAGTTVIATAHITIGSSPPFIRLLSGFTKWSDMRAGGYSFEFALAEKRNCTSIAGQIDDVSASWPGTGTYVDLLFTGFSSTSTSHELCVQMSHSSSIVMPWVSVSALLGAADHNVFLDPAALYNGGYQWQLEGLSSAHLQYGEPLRVIIPNGILSMSGLVHLAVDTSSDICSSYTNEDFQKSDLNALNATHVFMDVLLKRPPGQPGGGFATLCGNGGMDEPWVRLSSTSGGTVNYCPEGSALFQRGDRDQCMSCGPNASNPCHGGGYCEITQEPETLLATSMQCLCYDRHFGHNCEYFDMDPPTFDKPSGSYTTKKLTVTVTAPGPFDSIKVRRRDGSIKFCQGSCEIDLFETETLNATTHHINGSFSFRHSVSHYELQTPTVSTTITDSSIFTQTAFGKSPSKEPSATQLLTGTKSAVASISAHETKSSKLSSSQFITATEPQSNTLTRDSSPSTTRLSEYLATPSISALSNLSFGQDSPDFTVSTDTALIGDVFTVTHPNSYLNLSVICASLVQSTSRASQYVVTFNVSRCGMVVQIVFCTKSTFCRTSSISVLSNLSFKLPSLNPRFQLDIDRYELDGLDTYRKVLVGPFVANLTEGTLSIPSIRVINCSASPEQLFNVVHGDSLIDFVFARDSYDSQEWFRSVKQHICPASTSSVEISPSDFYIVGTAKLLFSNYFQENVLLEPGVWDTKQFSLNFTQNESFPNEDNVSFEIVASGNLCNCTPNRCACPSLVRDVIVATKQQGLQHQRVSQSIFELDLPTLVLSASAVNRTGYLTIFTQAAEVFVSVVVIASPIPVSLVSESLQCRAQLCRGNESNFPTTVSFEALGSESYNGNISVLIEVTTNLVRSQEVLTLEFQAQNTHQQSKATLLAFQPSPFQCRSNRIIWLVLVLSLAFGGMLLRTVETCIKGVSWNRCRSKKALRFSHKYYALLLSHGFHGFWYVAIVGRDWLVALGTVSVLGDNLTTGSSHPIPFSALLVFLLVASILRVLSLVVFPATLTEDFDPNAPKVPHLDIVAEDLQPSLKSLESLQSEHSEMTDSDGGSLFPPSTLGFIIFSLCVSSLGTAAFFLGQVCSQYSLKVTIVLLFDIFVLENALVLLTALYRWIGSDGHLKENFPSL